MPGFRDLKVYGDGPYDANIWIIGEGPGKDEEVQGKPFVGRAGEELNRLLAGAGIERRDVRVDNITKYKPYGKKEKAFFPDGRKPAPEFLEGIGELREDLLQHKPNVVVAVGKYALWGLTLKSKITSWRGSILESSVVPGQKLIPILHPSYLLRGAWIMRNPTIWDLQKVKRESTSPELNLPEYDITVAMTAAQLADARDEILAADEIVVDIETFGGRDLACVGYGLSTTRAIVVPYQGVQTDDFLKETLQNDIPKIAQNAMFELTFMAVCTGIRVEAMTFDTMLASHVLYPTLPHSLEFLCSIYSRQPYYKDDRKRWQKSGDLGLLWEYNAKDCCVELEVKQKEEIELQERGLEEIAQFEFDLLYPYAEATIVGTRSDKDFILNTRRRTERRIKRISARLEKKLGYSVNVRSPKQVKQAVYEDLGLPPRYHKKKLTTRKEKLRDLAAKTGSVECRMIVRLRELHKVISNYATLDILDIDDRFRCNWNIMGTKTGRLSSQSTLWDAGTNLQNQPQKFRRAFIPDEGMDFLVLDLMQAEAVVTAFLAEDEMEIEWFEQQLDSHVMLASLLFNKEPEDITFEERYLAKRCHHALNYRMGYVTFMYTVNNDYDKTGIGITQKEAEDLRNRVHAIRPALQGWWQRVISEARQHGEVVTLMGRRRPIFERWNDTLINDLISYNPQSTVGDVCHTGVKRYWQDEQMQELRREGRIDLLLQTHDGSVYQIDKEIFEPTAERLMQMGLVQLEANGREFTIPVEAHRGHTWAKDDLEEFAILRG